MGARINAPAQLRGIRPNLLAEIEKQLVEAELKGDVDDLVKGMIDTLKEAEAILETAGWPGGGDFLEALQGLAERAARAPEEMEIVTYDL